GDGDQEYLRACLRLSSQLRLANRFFVHPFIPHSDLAALLVDATVAMCAYAPLGINQAMPAPNKVYESMAMGLPVVVTAGRSVAEDVTICGGGVAVDPQSPGAIATGLNRLLRNPAFRETCG